MMRKNSLSGVVLISVTAALGASACCATSSTGGCLRSRTIRESGATGDVQQLAEWLRDPRSWVREESSLAVGRHRLVRLRGEVQARLLDEAEKPWVRAAAADALGALGGVQPETLAGVAMAPGTPPSVKIALVDALCRVVPKRGPSLVAGLLNDPDALVAAAAALKTETRCDQPR